MTAMTARQQFDNGAGLAMPPHPQYDAFIRPFHGRSLQDSAEGRSRLRSVIPGRATWREPGIPEIRGSDARIAPE